MRTHPENDFAKGFRDFAKLSRPLLNSEGQLPADGYVQIVPKGEFPNTATTVEGKRIRIVQVIDDAAIAAIVANSGEGFLDWEHESETPDGSTEAAAWFGEWEARPDGVYNRLRFSDKGEEAIKGRRWRFLSPVFAPDALQPLGKNRYRPTRVDGAGLTNRPNMKALRPITNREFFETNNPVEETTMNKEVLALLGLSEGASPEALLEKVKNTVEAAAKASELDAVKAELQTLKNKENEREVNAILDKHSKVVNKDNRARYAKLLNSDRETTVAVLEELSAAADKGSALDPAKRIHNREAGTPGATPGADDLPARQMALVTKVMNRDGIKDFDAAWQVARAEEPALFA